MLSALARFYDVPFDHPAEVHAASEWIKHSALSAAPALATDSAALRDGPATRATAPGQSASEESLTAGGFGAKAGAALVEVVPPR